MCNICFFLFPKWNFSFIKIFYLPRSLGTIKPIFFWTWLLQHTVGRKFLKSPDQTNKKLVKSNKLISRIFFSIFSIKWKICIQKKKFFFREIDSISFDEFSGLDFFNFSGLLYYNTTYGPWNLKPNAKKCRQNLVQKYEWLKEEKWYPFLPFHSGKPFFKAKLMVYVLQKKNHIQTNKNIVQNQNRFWYM